MQAEKELLFPPFRLDMVNECVWKETEAISLTPKAFAVLRYLVGHPGRLVTKEELLNAIWPDVYVSDAVLKVCVREIRKALGDQPKAPQFIETLHRRGYRFIAPLTTGHQPVASSQYSGVSSQKSVGSLPSAVGSQDFSPTPNPQHLTPRLVGREAELQQLREWLERALCGERQVVFVSGEAGIGKTTLMEAFLDQVAAGGNLWIARGQCIEHYGVGEAYLPVLEALGRLCRDPRGERLVPLLRQYAPTWLVQLPWLLNATDREGLQREIFGATRERMLREMAETIEAFTIETALVLVLEDLQWSDYSTLDLVSFLARRRELARLLVIGTYRPADVMVDKHPLKAVKQELEVHGQCMELPLESLTVEDVGTYLTARFSTSSLSPELARVIHRRTDGNPLFMVNLVEYVKNQGLIGEREGQWELRGTVEEIERGVPESLWQLITQQLERLSPEEQRALEAASTAGMEFSAAAVAAALETDATQVEEWCEKLARHAHFLRSLGVGEWPDGTVTARYGFTHALYQNVLYQRVAATRRMRLHQRIGEREERAYGERAKEIAAELAVHFERGRDYRRAVRYLQEAGENATRRSAHVEAISHLSKGLELLKILPDTVERAQQECSLQIALGASLMVTKGMAAPEAERAYARAQELCQQMGETPQLFLVLRGLGVFFMQQGKLRAAYALGEQCLTLAQNIQDPALLLEAHSVLGIFLYFMGELAPARAHLEQGSALYDPQQHRAHAFQYGFDPGVICRGFMAKTLRLLGYPDQALKRGLEVLAMAQELAHPQSLAFALYATAVVHQSRREGHLIQEWAEAEITLSTDQGFPLWLAWGTMFRGWALAGQGQGEEGIAQMRQGLTAFQAIESGLLRPYCLALLAEAYGKVGQLEEGLAVLAEALARVPENGERHYEAELYRLKGELLLKSKVQGPKSKVTNLQPLASTPQAEAEECFHTAIDIARRQSAKSLELRAAVSLSRLWQQQGKGKQARKLLAEIYGWFTEGFDTADLQEAKALLAELS